MRLKTGGFDFRYFSGLLVALPACDDAQHICHLFLHGLNLTTQLRGIFPRFAGRLGRITQFRLSLIHPLLVTHFVLALRCFGRRGVGFGNHNFVVQRLTCRGGVVGLFL